MTASPASRITVWRDTPRLLLVGAQASHFRLVTHYQVCLYQQTKLLCDCGVHGWPTSVLAQKATGLPLLLSLNLEQILRSKTAGAGEQGLEVSLHCILTLSSNLIKSSPCAMPRPVPAHRALGTRLVPRVKFHGPSHPKSVRLWLREVISDSTSTPAAGGSLHCAPGPCWSAW